MPGWCQFIAWDDPMGERTLEWGPVSAGKRVTNLDKLHSVFVYTYSNLFFT